MKLIELIYANPNTTVALVMFTLMVALMSAGFIRTMIEAARYK